MDWTILIVALVLTLSGLIELIVPRKVIDFSSWLLRNWYFTTPTKDWYRSNSPITIRIAGVCSLVLALVVMFAFFKRS